MAPKTRSADSPSVSPLDSHDPGCQRSSLVPTHDTLALVLEQMALINARMDAQSADVVVVAAITIIGARSRRGRQPPRDACWRVRGMARSDSYRTLREYEKLMGARTLPPYEYI
jgi:hypothetical protein